MMTTKTKNYGTEESRLFSYQGDKERNGDEHTGTAVLLNESFTKKIMILVGICFAAFAAGAVASSTTNSFGYGRVGYLRPDEGSSLMALSLADGTSGMSSVPMLGLSAAEIAADPEKFANAAKTTAEALGVAVDVFDKARTIIAGMTADKAIIINTTNKRKIWYTYNTISPVKLNTQFRSTMGPKAVVAVYSQGWGGMTTFADNKQPGYVLERGKVYYYTAHGDVTLWM